MEPTIAISALARLIGLGMKGWAALESHGFDDKDVAAIQAMLETGSSFAAMRNARAPAVAAQHLALVARSFGQAVGRHQEFHGKLVLAGGLRRWLSRSERQRGEEIELRVKVAALRPRGLGDDPRGEVDAVAALTASPLDTPYYRALWAAFSDPAMTLPDEEPPLVMTRTARREFERYFLLAYLAGLESAAGRGVAAYLDGLQRYRAMLVRDLLVQDMAAWGGRHVFGNLPRERWTDGDAVPFLPLDALYVEPAGKLELAAGGECEPEPLLALIDRLVAPDAPPRVIVVVADFGSGKSLSARMLAARWAERALAAASVSLDAVLPIYVRCAEDFPHEAVDLAATVRRAWKRQADGFGLVLSDDDDALAWPGDAQRAVCLLDGLDEVSLGEKHLRTLFQTLHGKTTARRRFIVLSRPGAVPSRSELGDGAAIVQLQPFSAGQVAAWIAGWNQHAPPGSPVTVAAPVTLAAIEALGLGELVKTPILLFMIAFTWGRRTARSEPPSLAEIYEGFFAQIAAGKADADRERHGPIAAASEALLAALQNHGALDERASLSDAMLWLMGRVAWEAQTLEQRQPPEPLTRRHVDNLLQDSEIRLPGDAAYAIRIGLVLALQADLRAADHRILFGHQSFREFLVGRHWAIQLHRIVRGNPRYWDAWTAGLLGGRLLGEQNKSIEFAMQIVNAASDADRPDPAAWTGADRAALGQWAQDAFNSEDQIFMSRSRSGFHGATRLRDDARAVLREAALAIGSLIHDSRGLQIADHRTLRAMLAWFWLQGVPPQVIARRAQLANANLAGASLDGADFEGANLDHAYLKRAELTGACLRDASLFDADLFSANLVNADLERACLTGARLTAATLVSARLDHARLDDARFEHAGMGNSSLVAAYMTGANLTGAKLYGSQLTGAVLERANLTEAVLADANLERARLTGANLARANLARANLSAADLSYGALAYANLERAWLADAKLVHAALAGANLRGADLARADLTRADCSGATLAGANLAGANLAGANLAGANLVGADLVGADLAGANLAGANLVAARLVETELRGAHHDDATCWPDGCDPAERGAIRVPSEPQRA